MDAAALGLPAMPAAGVGSQELAETLGISSILIQTGVLMIRRWGAQLPLGWLTFIFALNAVGMGIFHRDERDPGIAAVVGEVAPPVDVQLAELARGPDL